MSELARYSINMGVYIIPEIETLGHCSSLPQ